MPPAVSDDESDESVPDAIPAKAKRVDAEVDSEDDNDDEEEAEDEYQVERILAHKSDKGKIVYRIKWLGYDEEADKTWEPVENLENAKDIVAAYHVTIGGTPEPLPAKKAKGKRTAADAFDSPAPVATGKKKGGRKSEANGTSEGWEPPIGSWEEHVTRVAAIVEEDPRDSGIVKKQRDVKSLDGLLEWNNGKKTQHKMDILRQKCPQRLLDYYENHLKFVD